MQIALERADKHFAFFVGVLAGFGGFALMFTIVEGVRETAQTDQLRFWGAFLSGAVAVALFAATWWRDQILKSREAERIKHAIWIDLMLTLPAVYLEWCKWDEVCKDDTKRGAFFRVPRDSEHLTPTVLQANLSLIGEFSDDQALTGVLVHDNLRTLRQQIDRIGSMVGARIDDADRRAQANEGEDLCRVLCLQIDNAIRAFDPSARRRREISERTHDALFSSYSATTWDALHSQVRAWRQEAGRE